MSKKRLIAMTCDSTLHVILWRVVSVKSNIGKKITRLEIMKWNRKKSSMFPNLQIELMFKGGVTMFTGCFRKQTGRENI